MIYRKNKHMKIISNLVFSMFLNMSQNIQIILITTPFFQTIIRITCYSQEGYLKVTINNHTIYKKVIKTA